VRIDYVHSAIRYVFHVGKDVRYSVNNYIYVHKKSLKVFIFRNLYCVLIQDES